MPRSISLLVSAATLFLITWNLSCASQPLHLPPTLEQRTLRISEKVPGFEYQWRECTKSFLGICRNWEMKVEYYDLTVPAVRDKLINMGFVARVRDKVLP